MKSFLKYATLLTSSLAIILSHVITVEATTKCAPLTVPSKWVRWELVTEIEGDPATPIKIQKFDKDVPTPDNKIYSFQAYITQEKIGQVAYVFGGGDLQFRFEWVLTSGGTHNFWLKSGGECSINDKLPFAYNQVKTLNIYKRVFT